MLMESVVDFLLALFNYGKPSVDTSEIHRLLMVHGKWMMVMVMAHEWRPWKPGVVSWKLRAEKDIHPP
jgi:hypothetical protein